MRHLVYVIAFTGRFDAMRKFYETGLGLPVRRAEKDWVEFDTAGASLALLHMDDPARRGLMLRFVTADLDAALAEMRGRGVEPAFDVAEFRGSRYAHFWDSDRNALTLVEPAEPVPSGAGPPLRTVILNVGDMAAAIEFYRDLFGLPVLLESPGWTELETGATRLALHPRGTPTGELRHNAQPVVVGFEVQDFAELGRDLAVQGLAFSGGPVDERYGRFAEVTDPDGYVVLFRGRAARTEAGPEADREEDIAAPFETAAPRRSPMRKPAKKRTPAISRVVVKPRYRKKKVSSRVKKKGVPRPVVAPNSKRAKVKPATGRLKKAERKSAVRKKTAVARASRAKPVKGSVARRGAARRGAAKGGEAKRGARARGR